MSRYLPDGMSVSTYDKHPTIELPSPHRAWRGAAAWERLGDAIAEIPGARVAIDSYPGVEHDDLVRVVRARFPESIVIDVERSAARSRAEIDDLIAPFLTDDRVLGIMSHQELDDFYRAESLEEIRRFVERAGGPAILVGWGATLVPLEFDLIVLADLARWELQRRQRAGAPNWRAENGDEDHLRKVKRGYFVEWRIADRHKAGLFERLDFVLDTNSSVEDPALITGAAFRAGLAESVRRPFRVVPFFDPGVWGGQWMREVCGIEGDASNYAWCFDCVPEENSILFEADGVVIELPSIDIVLRHPRELLGERTFARFGAEFPIRFDFLDTMEGGNLSLQVHPLTDYIQRHFGMTYTQDESYYLLDAAPDAVVYLGVRDDVDPAAMSEALRTATLGSEPFAADDFVNRFPARKHDHFLIPAGTVHCSGADSMVLEISATPYIFTFKMWDWGRVGLDGIPRPIHLDHALANIQWDRDRDWVAANLVDQRTELASGDGWCEESTGLHELEFIEVRRHWSRVPTARDTRGTVHVLNLVEGAEATVSSPDAAFDPFVVHYAETFIVPAAVGPYIVSPSGPSLGAEIATVTAWVRGTRDED